MLNEYLPHSAALMADCLMRREGLLNDQWSYDYGVVWRGMEALWALTGEEKYLAYIRDALDTVVDPEGRVAGYDRQAFNLDFLCNGRQLLLLHRVTGEEKYALAADLLRSQLYHQPRTANGGFWHKRIYPFQMWLDGQHMVIPFYTEYARDHGDRAGLADAVRQLELAEAGTLDPETGLLRHGWDESRAQSWADPATGRAAHSWGRAVGWYMTALADTWALLPPEEAEKRERVAAILRRHAERLLAIRQEGVWLQVLDCPGRPGNYPEASGSCLIDYALLKGARLGVLPPETGDAAAESFLAIQRQFVGRMRDGTLFLAKTCRGAGLGGEARRDGSYDYYISEPIVSYDLKGTGAYIQAAVEYEMRNGK